MNKLNILLFIILYLYLNIILCPCDNINKGYCYRYEYKGVLISKCVTFLILGFFFSQYYLIIFGVFILWELFEMYLDKNEDIVFKYGGCLDKDIYNKEYIVGYGEEKYLNPIDKYFNIKNSKKHIWHGSLAEIFYSTIFFIIGYLIKLLLTKYLIYIN